jgi:AbrB family looped-hinge helix DNA binding protein
LPRRIRFFAKHLTNQCFGVILKYQRNLNILIILLLKWSDEMIKKGENEPCCAPIDRGISCCKVESVISVDDRGQMVLPKEIRDKAKIRAGDKLAVICWEKDGGVCCISLIKAEDFTEMVKGVLGPMMKEIIVE